MQRKEIPASIRSCTNLIIRKCLFKPDVNKKQLHSCAARIQGSGAKADSSTTGGKLIYENRTCHLQMGKLMSYREHRAAKILLIAAYSEVVFRGCLVRQEPPRCCNMTIDLLANVMQVNFQEIRVGGKVINLIEPLCPVCGNRVTAVYSIIN